MTKIISSVLAFSLTTFLYASDNSKLMDISISNGATDEYIEPITGANVKTNPILWGKFEATFHIEGFNPSFGYSRTYEGSTSTNSGKLNADKQSGERIVAHIPFDKIGLTGWAFNYSKYKFNSYLTAQAGYEVLLVDHTNTSAATGTMYYGDQGLSQASPGQSIGLTIQSQRFELIKNVKQRFGNSNKSYLGLFYQILKKPWEDSTEHWVDNDTGNNVSVVYSEATFKTIGITEGYKTPYKMLSKGFNIRGIGIDIGWVQDIKLTDNYSFNDKLGEDQAVYKVGMKLDLAYKIKTPFLGKGSMLVLDAFTNYDYYYLDTDTQSDEDTSIGLSNDFLYGASMTLVF